MSLRVILVTGGNGGLGRAIAQAFLAESPDNSVWLAVHQNRVNADTLANQYSGRCQTLTIDVTRRESWQQGISEVLGKLGRLDVLVNNAGTHQDALLGTMQIEQWESVRSINLDGVFHGCQAVLPTFIAQRGGRIVNIASLSALLAPAGQTNYAAAKAGVIALTQSLAKEVARLNITVNAVTPGYIDTHAVMGLKTEERKAAESRIPMRRFGQPEEVAAAVRFLASGEASYITGSVLKIDGGVL